LQLLAVLLVGFALPPRRAIAAMTLYLGCGLTGLPVFVPGSGGLLGATGGYLVGFLLCAWLVSTMTDGRQPGFLRLLAAGAAGTCIVFVLGITWRVLLVAILGWFGGNVGLAIVTGFAPFALKAVIELLLAVTLVTCLRQRWGDLVRRPAT
jgi:biotin transport system substrate-specific component